MPEYETYSVEITQQTGTIVPLQLKHLGIDKEYKEVVGGIVEDVREMSDVIAWYMILPCFLFCTVPYMMARLIYLNSKLRTSMQEKCEKANASPNVSGRAQFTPRAERSGRKGAERYFVDIEYLKDEEVGHDVLAVPDPELLEAPSAPPLPCAVDDSL
eukprot:TRINITY_DN2175_c0_g1_i3.p2 TRINITY_DN2175_c0_g1~~TRINITY_DN2175_c0_g1_i3.p2  ORF type:complete len:173 (+),score=51.99 TRINITY_DN2175_c0_g1_i3:47-520(+)